MLIADLLSSGLPRAACLCQAPSAYFHIARPSFFFSLSWFSNQNKQPARPSVHVHTQSCPVSYFGFHGVQTYSFRHLDRHLFPILGSTGVIVGTLPDISIGSHVVSVELFFSWKLPASPAGFLKSYFEPVLFRPIPIRPRKASMEAFFQWREMG